MRIPREGLVFNGPKINLGGGDILQVSSLNDPSPLQPSSTRVMFCLQRSTQLDQVLMSPEQALDIATQLVEHAVESWYVMGLTPNQVREFLVGTRLVSLVNVVEKNQESGFVASLSLAYQSLKPEAAELFVWLSTLPAGLELPMAVAIFGPDTPYLVEDLREAALLTPRLADYPLDRLRLSPFVREYAQRKLEAIPRERQLELFERTVLALEEFMSACAKRLDQPNTDEADALREAANRAALMYAELLEKRPQAQGEDAEKSQ